MAGADGGELVTTDATGENLLDTGGGVESPLVAVFHDRNRKWPRFVANDEHASIWTILRELPPFGRGNDKDVTVLARGLWIGRVDERLRLGAEEHHQVLERPCLGDLDQCLGGVLRGGKRSRLRINRPGREHGADRADTHERDREGGMRQ